MEENNFANLPAEAFTRGLYALYANSLALDGKEILKMYMQQKPKTSKSGNLSALRRSKLAQEVETMAERPAFRPISFFGLVLLLLLFFGGFLCWYFSWNPATYLSQKLRSLEQPPGIEQVSAHRQTEPNQQKLHLKFPRMYGLRPHSSDLFGLTYPSIATEALAQNMPKDEATPPPQRHEFPMNVQANATEQTRSPSTEKRSIAIDHSDQPQQ